MSFSLSKRAKSEYVEKRKEDSGNITYVYNEKHIKERNKKKAEKLSKLAKSLKSLRSQLKKDIKSDDDKIKIPAIAVALMDETYERVGNRYSAVEGHYGATTWLVKHIKFNGSKAKIKYVGKSGIKQDKTVKTPSLVSALKALCKGKSPNTPIFETEDILLNDNIVNKYLRPFNITAKDIRGLHANAEVVKFLKAIRKGKLPTDQKEKEKQLKKEFKEAVEQAAEVVGHKASTLKNQYLIPGLEEKYITKGQIIGPKIASNTNISKIAGFSWAKPILSAELLPLLEFSMKENISLDSLKRDFKSGQLIFLDKKQWQHLENTNSLAINTLQEANNIVQNKTLLHSFEEQQPIPAPIVFQRSDNSLVLVSGNDRLIYAHAFHLKPSVYLIRETVFNSPKSLE